MTTSTSYTTFSPKFRLRKMKRLHATQHSKSREKSHGHVRKHPAKWEEWGCLCFPLEVIDRDEIWLEFYQNQMLQFSISNDLALMREDCKKIMRKAESDWMFGFYLNGTLKLI